MTHRPHVFQLRFEELPVSSARALQYGVGSNDTGRCICSDEGELQSECGGRAEVLFASGSCVLVIRAALHTSFNEGAVPKFFLRAAAVSSRSGPGCMLRSVKGTY
ncbi:hypothetical protein NDU88_009674 [Pleurodeles waltl]|uniref:Uncharacterized protein n=1 Tax=Pleurodeles waltl TaxID=8319 RepID=A0AAV7PSS6_PLEWA|nr:hypothetical protein NDU88_009674 [Pleurodeles waltl]